ncbi:hypothetical protein ACQ4LE_002378 [Meloidogyne hapla]
MKSIILILFFLLQFNPIFGVKFLPSEKLLVENAKENVFYLFQFPRSSKTICLSVESLKVEVFLKLNGINFYRISNHLFLDSPTGQTPFAQYNGKYIDGSKNIIALAKEIIINRNNNMLENEQKLISKKILNKIKKIPTSLKIKNIIPSRRKVSMEEEIIGFSEIMFGILMFDRVTRLSKDFGGLEFFLEDEALVEEFIYSNPFDYRNLNIQTDKEKYEIFLTPEFWEAFFKFVKIWKEGKYEKSLEIKWKEEEKKLKSKYHQNEPGTSSLNQDFASTSSIRDIKGKSKMFNENEDKGNILEEIILEENTKFEIENNKNKMDKIREDFLKKYVNPKLKANDFIYFINIINNFLKISLESLFIGDWAIKNDAKNYKYQNLKLIHKNIIKIMNKTLQYTDGFLFGDNFTEADASLFAILIQLFETTKHLDFKELFLYDAYKEALSHYVDSVTKKLGLDKKEYQKVKQRPWTLNYEQINLENNEYNGPFVVQMPNFHQHLDIIMNYDFLNIFNQANDVEKISNALKEKFNFIWNPDESLILFTKIVYKIKENSKDFNLDEEDFSMIIEAFLYLCKECRLFYQENSTKVRDNLMKKTRKIVFDTIIEFNEEKISKNVLVAIEESFEKTFPQKKEEDARVDKH